MVRGYSKVILSMGKGESCEICVRWGGGGPGGSSPGKVLTFTCLEIKSSAKGHEGGGGGGGGGGRELEYLGGGGEGVRATVVVVVDGVVVVVFGGG